jgi:hypothetical protein
VDDAGPGEVLRSVTACRRRLFDATREQILGALERYEACFERDRLLVYYAGHGEEELAADGGADAAVGYQLPVDARKPRDVARAIPNRGTVSLGGMQAGRSDRRRLLLRRHHRARRAARRSATGRARGTAALVASRVAAKGAWR